MTVTLVENIRWILWNSKILQIKRKFIILNFVNLFSWITWIICMRIYFPDDSECKSEIEFVTICMIIWTLLTILGVLIFNVYCFYHWSMTQFKSKNIKKNWLAILLLSYGLSGGIFSLSYYILVVEMKYGISQDCDTLCEAL